MNWWVSVPTDAESTAFALVEHKEHIRKYGDDLPAISGWKWGMKESVKAGGTSTGGDNP